MATHYCRVDYLGDVLDGKEENGEENVGQWHQSIVKLEAQWLEVELESYDATL